MIERLFKHYKTTILGLVLIAAGVWIILNDTLEESTKSVVALTLIGGGLTALGLKDNLITKNNGFIKRRAGKPRQTGQTKRG